MAADVHKGSTLPAFRARTSHASLSLEPGQAGERDERGWWWVPWAPSGGAMGVMGTFWRRRTRWVLSRAASVLVTHPEAAPCPGARLWQPTRAALVVFLKFSLCN